MQATICGSPLYNSHGRGRPNQCPKDREFGLTVRGGQFPFEVETVKLGPISKEGLFETKKKEILTVFLK